MATAKRLALSAPKRARDDDTANKAILAWLAERGFGYESTDAVKQLDLYAKTVTSLPPSIGVLGALTRLDLGDNELAKLPNEIGNLRALVALSLSGNRLASLPATMSKLSVVMELRLADNPLKTLPAWLGNLNTLTTLVLENTSLSEIPRALGKLRRLHTLLLGRNMLTALPEEFGELRALTILDLSSNQLTVLPESFGQLDGLLELVLSRNRFVKVPRVCGKLIRLEKLFFEDNPLEDVPSESIAGLRALRFLGLESNRRLRTLPSAIGELERLDDLNLNTMPLLQSIPEKLGDLRVLTILRLANCSLENLPPGIDGLRSLVQLYLYGNKLTSLPDTLGNLSTLQTLDVGNNRLLSVPQTLGQLTALELLSLVNNQLTTLPADLFRQLTQLRKVRLGANRLVLAPPSLASLRRATISLVNNELSFVPMPNHRSLSFVYEIGGNRLLASFMKTASYTTPYGSFNDQRRTHAEQSLVDDNGGLAYWSRLFEPLSSDDRVLVASLFVADATVAPWLYATLTPDECTRALQRWPTSPLQSLRKQIALSDVHYVCSNANDPFLLEPIAPYDRLVFYDPDSRARRCYSRTALVHWFRTVASQTQQYVRHRDNQRLLGDNPTNYYVKTIETRTFFDADSFLRIADNSAQVIYHMIPLFDGYRIDVGRVDTTNFEKYPTENAQLFTLVPAHVDSPEYVDTLPFPTA